VLFRPLVVDRLKQLASSTEYVEARLLCFIFMSTTLDWTTTTTNGRCE